MNKKRKTRILKNHRNELPLSSVFDYTDFRKFLKDRYNAMKKNNSRFNYDYIIKRAGFKSRGSLTQIFQGKSSIRPGMISKFGSIFRLKKEEKKYFKQLVLYNQAESHTEKKKYFKKMIEFPGSSVGKIDPDKYEIFDKWYYTAVRAILNYTDFYGDYEKLAKMTSPQITPTEAKKSIETLKRLGIIAKNQTGAYRLVSKHLSTGADADSVVVNNYLINTLDIAKDALYRFNKKDRTFSALGVSVSKQGYEKILDEAEQFRRRIVEIVKNDSDIDRVYQINTQIFPLSNISWKERGKK